MQIAYDIGCSLSQEAWISLSKPQAVFKACFRPFKDKIVPVIPVTLQDIALAHDYQWAEEVLALQADNGFGNRTDEELQQVLYANGTMVAATNQALSSGHCFAPVSGFHHAGYSFNGGFCTFNGLIIALHKLKQAGKITTALILDFDGHYGNGTADIIHEMDLLWIQHLTRHYPFETPKKAVDDACYAISQKPDIVIYQAGADSHVNDSYNVGYFSDEEWRARDKAIFEYCHQSFVPIVWNLAGGYNGAETVALHKSTFDTACSVFELARDRHISAQDDATLKA